MITGVIDGLVNGTEQIVFDYEVPSTGTTALFRFENNYSDSTGQHPDLIPVAGTNGSIGFDGSIKKMGSYSLHLLQSYPDPMTRAYCPLSFPLATGTSDFTFDTWIYVTHVDQYSSTVFCLSNSPTGYGTAQISLGYRWTSNRWEISSDPFLPANNGIVAQSPWSQDIWHHVALVRKDQVAYLFFDGQLLGSLDWTGSFPSTLQYLHMGLPYNADLSFNGYMDSFRASNIARWTESFSVPTSPYELGVTSISTGDVLNGNEDVWYTIITQIVAIESTDNNYGIYINGDDGINYGYRGFSAIDSTLADINSNTGTGWMYVGTSDNGHCTLGVHKLHAKSGQGRLLTSTFVNDAGKPTVYSLASSGQVWDNLTDNVKSIQVSTNHPLTIGPGSRLTVLKTNKFKSGTKCGKLQSNLINGTWQRIERFVSTGVETSKTFSNLDGDRDILYKLSVSYKCVSEGSSLKVCPNGDEGSNYNCQYIMGMNGTIHRGRIATNGYQGHILYGPNTNDSTQVDYMIFAKSGHPRPAISYGIDRITGELITLITIMGHSWSNTMDNIENLYVSGQTGAFGEGTEIDLYALRPNG